MATRTPTFKSAKALLKERVSFVFAVGWPSVPAGPMGEAMDSNGGDRAELGLSPFLIMDACCRLLPLRIDWKSGDAVVMAMGSSCEVEPFLGVRPRVLRGLGAPGVCAGVSSKLRSVIERVEFRPGVAERLPAVTGRMPMADGGRMPADGGRGCRELGGRGATSLDIVVLVNESDGVVGPFVDR
eukprot:COSAG01_NODE_7550_length_3156_cov_2.407589_2_plen_184_part_00